MRGVPGRFPVTPSGPGAGGHRAGFLKAAGTGDREEALARPGRLHSQAGEWVRGGGGQVALLTGCWGRDRSGQDLARSSLEASLSSGLIFSGRVGLARASFSCGHPGFLP